jgi:hypothetical protein
LRCDSTSIRGVPGLIIGDVAGALHGWPLALGSSTVEVCGLVDTVGYRFREMGAREARSGRHIVSGGVSVVIDEAPAARRDSLALQTVLDVQRELLGDCRR